MINSEFYGGASVSLLVCSVSFMDLLLQLCLAGSKVWCCAGSSVSFVPTEYLHLLCCSLEQPQSCAYLWVDDIFPRYWVSSISVIRTPFLLCLFLLSVLSDTFLLNERSHNTKGFVRVFGSSASNRMNQSVLLLSCQPTINLLSWEIRRNQTVLITTLLLFNHFDLIETTWSLRTD